jgi:hypothetical protein
MRNTSPERKGLSYKPNENLLVSQLSPNQRRDLAIPTRSTDTLIACIGGHDRSPRLTLATRLHPGDVNCVYLVGGLECLRHYLDSFDDSTCTDATRVQMNTEYSKQIRDITGHRRKDYYKLLYESAIKHVIVTTKTRYEGMRADLIRGIINGPRIEYLSKKTELAERLQLPLELLMRNFPEALD